MRLLMDVGRLTMGIVRSIAGEAWRELCIQFRLWRPALAHDEAARVAYAFLRSFARLPA